jgi:hypothetical protein
MVIIQAYADWFVSNPDPIEYAGDAQEWAAVVVDVGSARLDTAAVEGPDICGECGQVIVWVDEFALWAVDGDAWSRSGVRCAGSFDLMHTPGPGPVVAVVEVAR